MNEVENFLYGLNNIFEITGKQINRFEDWSMGISHSQDREEKKSIKKKIQKTRKLWENLKHIHMDIMLLLDRLQKHKGLEKNIWKSNGQKFPYVM